MTHNISPEEQLKDAIELARYYYVDELQKFDKKYSATSFSRWYEKDKERSDIHTRFDNKVNELVATYLRTLQEKMPEEVDQDARSTDKFSWGMDVGYNIALGLSKEVLQTAIQELEK